MRRSIRWSVGAAVAALVAGASLPGAFAAGPAAHPAAGTAAKQAPFYANSMSWLGSQDAWLIGSGGCTGKPCSGVKATTDGGKTWTTIGSVPAHMLVQAHPKRSDVSEIRMATSSVGWAYGPKLYATTDGGKTWSNQPIPGGGAQIFSLAADSSGAWAVVSPCTYGKPICKQGLSLWTTTASGKGTWTKVDLTLPHAFEADVAANGTSVYLVVPQLEFGGTDLLYASTDGTTFTSRTQPCDNTDDIGLLQAVATTTKNVYLLCDGNPGFSKAVKTVYGSTDNAKTTTSLGTMGELGIQASLAASKSGNLAVASSSDGSFVYINDTKGGTTWTMPVGIGDGGTGWGDIQYVSNTTAWLVYAPADGFSPQDTLLVTHNAGQSWQQVHP
jgi:hypothetical protein